MIWGEVQGPGKPSPDLARVWGGRPEEVLGAWEVSRAEETGEQRGLPGTVNRGEFEARGLRA